MRGDQIERLRGNIAQARIDSLDRPVNGDGTVIPLSATVTDPATQIEDTLDNQEMVGYLRDGVTLLPERHRIVVIGYFFEGRSMTELGTLLGVTQSRASQLKDEAIKMLRSGLDQVYHDRESPEAVPSTGRQKAFNDALATSRPWRQRITAGQGFSAIAPDDRVPDDRVPADRVNVRT